MRELRIGWQRLVDSGVTCPRCAGTGEEVCSATATLTAALAPLGTAVRLDQEVVPLTRFTEAPLESNRILIDGRTLEDWLGGETGQGPCCDVCGSNDCRTVTVDGVVYEAIPADLIVRAGPLASIRLLAEPDRSESCCGPVRSTRSAVGRGHGQPTLTPILATGASCCS